MLWAGVDFGSSQLTVAIEGDDGALLAAEQIVGPAFTAAGRDEGTRVRALLPSLARVRKAPVMVAGAASDEVVEAFRREGWVVAGSVQFNDVVNHYGLGQMRGNTVVAACGSGVQVVWFDDESNVRWPSDELAMACPEWLLFGQAYVRFLRERYPDLVPIDSDVFSFRQAPLWRALGGQLAVRAADPAVEGFLRDGARAVAETFRLFQDATGGDQPWLELSGGALSDDRVWAIVSDELARSGLHACRLGGMAARGAIAYARRYGDRDFWGWFGKKKPSWLSWSKEDWTRYYDETP